MIIRSLARRVEYLEQLDSRSSLSAKLKELHIIPALAAAPAC